MTATPPAGQTLPVTTSEPSRAAPDPAPSPQQLRRWRQYLADELAEAAVYRDLARHRSGEEREILLALAEAEGRHEAHWLALLGDQAGKPLRADYRTRLLGLLARRFGSVFVLAQAIVGAVSASGVDNRIVLLTGLAGLLAGALSMGAGEYVSVRSQRELLDASTPDPEANTVLPQLDIDANELALLYRARGMDPAAAQSHADEVLGALTPGSSAQLLPGPRDDLDHPSEEPVDEHEAIGTSLGAAVSSFFFFASGAVVPVLPYVFGLEGLTAVILAAVLVGLALLATGATVGLLSGASPLKRGVRQLGIGYGAAAVTYLLGLLFGTGAI